MNEAQGKKEVVEAVAIAALTALATELVEWIIEIAKKRAAAKEKG
jgi:hypothetical protein